MKVVHECSSCSGTGLYSGFAEGKGSAVICLSCNGQGWQMETFREFKGRKHKNGINSISTSRGTFVATGVGAVGKTMTYAEFEAKHPVKVPKV